MALVSPLLSSFLSPTSPQPSLLFPSSASTRSQAISLGLRPSSVHGFHCHVPVISQKRCSVVAMATADGPEPVYQSENKEDKTEVEDLPLESKEQLKLEQKLRMKMAKKIRLRRKRLVRKRHMRKKGRWPPSKMKKLKNV